MTSQEEQMLNSLVERVNSTQLTEKDPDAAELLKRGFGTNPDALYVLAQSVLVQNIALEQAHAQLQQQQAAPQPARASSFLGGLLSRRDPAPPPLPPGYQGVNPAGAQPGYQQVYTPPEYQAPYYPNQPYGGPQYGAPGYAAPMGQPSFLRSAAQTAAGVAAGALAFEGVEALLHGGFGHPGMGMGMGGWGMPGVGMGMGYERPIEENVVNNYYESPEPEHHSHESVSDGGWGGDSGGSSDSGSGFDDSGSSWDGGGSGNDDGGF